MLGIKTFTPIMLSKNIIIKYAIKPFNLYEKNLNYWINLRKLFCIFYLISSLIISYYFTKCINNFFVKKIKKYRKKEFKNNKKIFKKSKINFENNIKNIFKKIKKKNNYLNKKKNNNCNELKINIGKIYETKNDIFISERGLYQNILITGTIGSGKTSSAMYPISKQLIEYMSYDNDKKIGMLILDVKGNYYKYIKKVAYECERFDDVVVIEIGGKYVYNPLDKPDIKASVLANRLRIILDLFSGESSESYWTDKSEQILGECIKLCRIYNNGYVDFNEIHKLVSSKEYYLRKISDIRGIFLKNTFSKEDCYNLYTSIKFFDDEFYKLDDRTMSILKSQITRITGCFISDFEVKNTFNSKCNYSNSINLQKIIDEGKIVVLNMNISQYKNLSKIIAAYLKLDFQSEVLSRLAINKNKERSVAFISDEYQEYVTETDADFFSQSREAKCINVVATQSYTSLLKTLKNETVLKVVLQNLINKIWFRTDDLYTIEEAQKQIGKIEKEKVSTNISENARETKYLPFSNSFRSKDSSISESINKSTEKEFVFDTNFFTQNLETFCAVTFISDGDKILEPKKTELIPYFRRDVI